MAKRKKDSPPDRRQQCQDLVADDIQLLFLDPPEMYDPCIVGVCERFGSKYAVIYDYGKVLAALCDSGMEPDEAVEWFEFNMVGAYVGEETPVYLHLPERAHATG